MVRQRGAADAADAEAEVCVVEGTNHSRGHLRVAGESWQAAVAAAVGRAGAVGTVADCLERRKEPNARHRKVVAAGTMDASDKKERCNYKQMGEMQGEKSANHASLCSKNTSRENMTSKDTCTRAWSKQKEIRREWEKNRVRNEGQNDKKATEWQNTPILTQRQ